MGYFRTKNPHLGKFGWAFDWKKLVYFMAIWNIIRPICLWPFGNLVAKCNIFPRFGILRQEKSGNPE
jgi:hypothetical protein